MCRSPKAQNYRDDLWCSSFRTIFTERVINACRIATNKAFVRLLTSGKLLDTHKMILGQHMNAQMLSKHFLAHLNLYLKRVSLFWVPVCFTPFEHRIEQAQLVPICHHWACGSGAHGALGPTKPAKSIKISIFRHRGAHSKDVFFLGTPLYEPTEGAARCSIHYALD